jgi:hypothetical protein
VFPGTPGRRGTSTCGHQIHATGNPRDIEAAVSVRFLEYR